MDQDPCIPHSITAVLLALGLTATQAGQSAYELQWDPVNDPRLSGYRLYLGDAPGDYHDVIELGSQTQYRVEDLDPERIYYFAITALDQDGNESDFSPEITSGRYRLLTGLGAFPENGGWNVVLNANRQEEQRLRVDWPEYNELSGETRIATGDIDGDGKQEIVIGLGPVAAADDMPRGAFQVLDDDFQPLTWGQVSWPEYNSLNGETRPAIGDLDGDGRGEIVIGLGQGGAGLVQIFTYANKALTAAGWADVDWPEYAESNGETRPAVGDLDGDGIGELVIGFGSREGVGGTAGGNFVVKDDVLGADAGFAQARFASDTQASPSQQLLAGVNIYGVLSWSDYATQIGGTYPAVGDVDGDGRDEIVIGLGSGGNGTIEIFDYEDGTILPLTTANLSWPEYNAFSGETRPAVGDIDGDGLSEVMIGLGPGGHGRVEVFESQGAQLWHQESLNIAGEDYGLTNGESWPAIKLERPR